MFNRKARKQIDRNARRLLDGKSLRQCTGLVLANIDVLACIDSVLPRKASAYATQRREQHRYFVARLTYHYVTRFEHHPDSDTIRNALDN
jgi:hypothetical protein